MTWPGVALVAGEAEGPVLVLAEPISFWGGVDPATGRINDVHHPQFGVGVSASILITTEGRGSSSASSVLAEMIREDCAPAAILMERADPIIVLGAVVASELYDLVMPVLTVPAGTARSVPAGTRARVSVDGWVTLET